MLREIGITLFLACVGISAGDGFVDTIVNNGGFAWIGYGFIITTVPLLIIGCVGRYFYKINYFTLLERYGWKRRSFRRLRNGIPIDHVFAGAYGAIIDLVLRLMR